MIDDSYNASPVAMQQSLKHFTGNVAIIGDMLELGKDSLRLSLKAITLSRAYTEYYRSGS